MTPVTQPAFGMGHDPPSGWPGGVTGSPPSRSSPDPTPATSPPTRPPGPRPGRPPPARRNRHHRRVRLPRLHRRQTRPPPPTRPHPQIPAPLRPTRTTTKTMRHAPRQNTLLLETLHPTEWRGPCAHPRISDPTRRNHTAPHFIAKIPISLDVGPRARPVIPSGFRIGPVVSVSASEQEPWGRQVGRGRNVSVTGVGGRRPPEVRRVAPGGVAWRHALA